MEHNQENWGNEPDKAEDLPEHTNDPVQDQRESLSLSSIGSLDSQLSRNNRDSPQSLHGKNASATKYQSNRSLSKISRKSTNSSAKTNRVSVGKRRGLLGQITVIPEYKDARNYPKHYKYAIVSIIAFAAICGPMGTSIMLPAISDMVVDLHTTPSMVNITVGLYLYALGIFPIWWSKFSETYGRRNIYLISFTLFLAFSVGAALAPSIGSLFILRVLQGGSSASVQAVGAGTVSDLFIPEEMGKSMGIYYLGPLIGPFAAPIIGGAVGEAWGWRATQWVLVIASGISLFTIVFFLPETLRKFDPSMLNTDESSEEEKDIEKGPPTNQPSEDIEQTQAVNSRADSMPNLSKLPTARSQFSASLIQNIAEEHISRQASINNRLEYESIHSFTKWQKFRTGSYDMIVRPVHAMILLRYPPIAWVVTYSAVTFGTIYFFNLAISNEFSVAPYNFSSVILGLMYIPNSITYIIASVFGGKWTDQLLKKYADNHNGQLVPEARFSWNVVIAVAIFAPACFIFGWTLDYGKIWVAPLVGTACFGFGSMLIIGSTVTFLVQSLPGKGATGVALNNLARQIVAGSISFAVDPALNAIGPGILFSIIYAILLVTSFTLYVAKKRSPYWREKYDLANFYSKL